MVMNSQSVITDKKRFLRRELNLTQKKYIYIDRNQKYLNKEKLVLAFILLLPNALRLF